MLNSIVLNAALDLEIAAVGPFPKAFESSHTNRLKISLQQQIRLWHFNRRSL